MLDLRFMTELEILFLMFGDLTLEMQDVWESLDGAMLALILLIGKIFKSILKFLIYMFIYLCIFHFLFNRYRKES